ncbi:MAG TPA: hypothetical protein VFO93_02725 [Hymenobacter sp.]|uniref:hypothetical protein n=1 Tax=Hymenobacter sp. TaxID=1898978 RepID=UPI002D7FD220|nr:hypothetical protein [Hymenobacter sp.]HET9502429.1 hypothetical protein [Hymenobacter sp.]
MKTTQSGPAAQPETRLLFNPFLPFTPTMSGNTTSFFPLGATDAGTKDTSRRGRRKAPAATQPH